MFFKRRRQALNLWTNWLLLYRPWGWTTRGFIKLTNGFFFLFCFIFTEILSEGKGLHTLTRQTVHFVSSNRDPSPNCFGAHFDLVHRLNCVVTNKIQNRAELDNDSDETNCDDYLFSISLRLVIYFFFFLQMVEFVGGSSRESRWNTAIAHLSLTLELQQQSACEIGLFWVFVWWR